MTIKHHTMTSSFHMSLHTANRDIFRLFRRSRTTATNSSRAIALNIMNTKNFFQNFIMLTKRYTRNIRRRQLTPVLFFATTNRRSILFTRLSLFRNNASTIDANNTNEDSKMIRTLSLRQHYRTDKGNTTRNPYSAM